MANLADSAVTIEDSWSSGGITGKRHVEMIVTLVLTGQGSATNKILATNFGLTKIESCGAARKSDDTVVYPACPSYDGSYLQLVDLTNATDATRAAPADITATVRVFLTGYR